MIKEVTQDLEWSCHPAIVFRFAHAIAIIHMELHTTTFKFFYGLLICKKIIKILIVISWKFMTKTAISFIAFDGGWSHYVLHSYCSIYCCIQKSCQWRGGKTGICQKLMGGVKPPSMCVGTWPIKEGVGHASLGKV